MERQRAEAMEKLKIEFSSRTQTDINSPRVPMDALGLKHIIMKLSITQLKKIVNNPINKTIGPCRKAMNDIDVPNPDIGELTLVGNMPRHPMLRMGRIVVKCQNTEPAKKRGQITGIL